MTALKLFHSEPFSGPLLRDFEHFFSGNVKQPLASSFPASGREFEDRFELKFEVPGVVKEDISIELDQLVLKLSVDKKPLWSAEEGKNLLGEISSGKAARSFKLPSSADTGQIAASYDHGVLTLTIPKLPESTPRKITVT